MTLPSGRKLENSLLSAIRDAGGQAKPSNSYPAVTARFPHLTDQDIGRVLSSGGSAWIKRIQFARQHLVMNGEIARFPRATWALTSKGRERLDSGQYVPLPSVDGDTSQGPSQSLHTALQGKLKEIGEILHKHSATEYRESPYVYDVIWKEDAALPRASHVFEVQHHGSLADALLKLKHAHDVWRPRLFLVVTGERDRGRLNAMLGPLFEGVFHEIRAEIITLTGDDVDGLHGAFVANREIIEAFIRG
jgi:hypothetical protein